MIRPISTPIALPLEDVGALASAAIADFSERCATPTVASVDTAGWGTNAGLVRRDDGPHLVVEGGILAAFAELPQPERALRAVIGHEFGHIVRRDLLVLNLRLRIFLIWTLCLVGAVIYMADGAAPEVLPGWFTFAAAACVCAWLFAAAHDRGAEFAADSFALSLGVRPDDLALAFASLEAYDKLLHRLWSQPVLHKLWGSGPPLPPSALVALVGEARPAPAARRVLAGVACFADHPSFESRLRRLGDSQKG
jgi:Zn-dependent protease with chaperone function